MALRDNGAFDFSKAKFPWQSVLMLIGAAGAVWTMEAGLRSDLRNLNTLMQAQAETTKLQRELDRGQMERAAEKQQANIDALKATIDAMEKAQQLLKVEFQQFKESMLTMQGMQGRR